MAVKFINKLTGTEMWVADERKDEYIGAGHKLAPDSLAKKPEPQQQVTEEPEEEVKEEIKPKKAVRKK